MNSDKFQEIITDEVKSYKSLLETSSNDWIIKGFIDINKNIYTLTTDTKVISKLVELILIPHLKYFAQRYDLTLELPSSQNFYPDLTFKDSSGNIFAVDFKSSYYNEKNKVNGLTLGSYWGYFRNRSVKSNTDYPYGDYKCHLVLGVLYKQSDVSINQKNIYTVDELNAIKSVIENFIFFVQPKWKIACDRPGSGNTRNIGAVSDIEKLINGKGTFASLGEEVFNDYWVNYFNVADAKALGLGTPRYNDLESYRKYLSTQQKILKKIGDNL